MAVYISGVSGGGGGGQTYTITDTVFSVPGVPTEASAGQIVSIEGVLAASNVKIEADDGTEIPWRSEGGDTPWDPSTFIFVMPSQNVTIT